MKSLNPCLTLSNVREILHSTADKIGNYTYTNGWNEKVGYGRINARKALETIDNMMLYGDQIITTSVDYTEDLLIATGDIIIENGGELTIADNCILRMGELNKVIVKPGGTLVSNGTITSSSCGNGTWEGIQVWGNSYQPQMPFSNQGYAYFREGSVVENAKIGVLAGALNTTTGAFDHSKYGGIIHTKGATFRNNIIGVYMGTYPYPSGTANNASHFYLSNFITNSDMSDYTDLDPEYLVKLINVNGIMFKGCKFENQRAGSITNPYAYDDRGMGIYSYRSMFYVEEYPAELPGQQDTPCEFTKLKYGISANGISSDDFMKVEDAVFTNNYRSIYSCTMNTPTIVNNTFNIPAADKAVGLYIDSGVDFVIEDNHFLSTDYNAGQYGILVNENPHENEIYKNEFAFLTWGFSSQGDTYADNIGICLTCNDFHNNIEDISVISNHGICENQGTIIDPAFNLFTVGTQNTYDIYNEPRDLNYYVTSSANGNQRFHPFPYTVSTVDLIYSSTPFTSSDCLTRYHNIGIVSEKTSDIDILESEIVEIDNTLATLTDNGSTEILQSEVENSIPSQSVDLYNDLMLSSEYVSEAVLLTSVEKEEVLNNNQITDILSENPQGAKDQSILNELNNRSQPLSQEQWTQVLAGKETTGARENNIAEKNMLFRDINKLETDISRIYLEDTLNPASLDNAYNRLLTREDRFSKYFAAFTALERKDLTLVNSIMADIYLMLETTEDFAIHQDMVDLISITTDYFFGVDNTFPTITQVGELAALVNKGFYPGLLAKNILLGFDQTNYMEPIVESTLLKSRIADWKPIVASESNSDISVYPNPASNRINISMTGINTTTSFELRSQTGQLVMNGDLDYNKSFHSINIENIQPGIYSLLLFSNKNKVLSQKLSIQ